MIAPVQPRRNSPQVLAQVTVAIIAGNPPQFGIRMPEGQSVKAGLSLLAEGIKMLSQDIEDPAPVPKTNVVLPDGSKAVFKKPTPDEIAAAKEENLSGLPPAPIGEKTNGS